VHCLSCGYDLQNLDGNHCPECGRIFDPSDDRTFQSPASARLSLHPSVRLVILLFIGVSAIGLALIFFVSQMYWGP